MGVDPVSIGAETAIAAPAIEGASKGAEAAGALAPAAAGAADVGAAAIPAGATALPEITVEAGAPIAAEAGAGAGAGAATGGIGDLIGGLGVGSAEAAGLAPSSIVAGEFGQLPSTAMTGTTPYRIGSSPFVGGPTPLPTPAPGVGGGTSPSAPGAGGPANTVVSPGDPTTIATGGPATGTTSDPLNPLPYEGNINTAANPSNPLPSSDLGGGIGDFFSKNKGLLSLLGLGVGGQLLGPQISKALGLNKVPGSENLDRVAQQAGELAQQQKQFGSTLEQPIVTGNLPSGAEQSVQRALSDAITTIKSRYGSLGLSGSTMEADAISNAQQAANIQRFKIEQEMATTGIQATQQATSNLGLEEGIYNTLLTASINQDAALGNAISNFATAAGMGTAIGAAKAA